MRLTPGTELELRISRLQAALAAQDLEAALISQNADLFYFSGTMQTAQLFVPTSGEPLLMVRRSHERARRESALADVVPLATLRDVPRLIAVHGLAAPRSLGLEMDVLPVNSYLALQRAAAGSAAGRHLADDPGDARGQVPYEIAIQREAAVLMDRVFAAIAPLVRPGMTEVELAGLIEAEARRDGHPGFVRMRGFNQEIFYGHVLAGESGAVPSFTDSPTGGVGLGPSMPQGAGWRRIEAGEPVFVDLVAMVDGLMVDQTRVFAIDSLPAELSAAQTPCWRSSVLSPRLSDRAPAAATSTRWPLAPPPISGWRTTSWEAATVGCSSSGTASGWS